FASVLADLIEWVRGAALVSNVDTGGPASGHSLRYSSARNNARPATLAERTCPAKTTMTTNAARPHVVAGWTRRVARTSYTTRLSGSPSKNSRLNGMTNAGAPVHRYSKSPSRPHAGAMIAIDAKAIRRR